MGNASLANKDEEKKLEKRLTKDDIKNIIEKKMQNVRRELES